MIGATPAPHGLLHPDKPFGRVWMKLRVRLLQWLADGRPVIMNAPFMYDSNQTMYGHWIIFHGCYIYPGRPEEFKDGQKAIDEWQAEHPKAMHLEPKYEGYFKVQGGAPATEEGITLQ